jgi:hypothetical protein
VKKAYCNAHHPLSGQPREATCYWKIDGQKLVSFAVSSPSNYDALFQAVHRLLTWAADHQESLTIYVVNQAIPRNRDLIRLCGRTDSDIVWMPKTQYLAQLPTEDEDPATLQAAGLAKDLWQPQLRSTNL